MTLAVIGAGLSRTGTLSLKFALEQLGFGPCFHMLEFIKPEYEPRRTLWARAAAGEPPDWETIFAGFSSAVDMPACLYYRKLTRAYPQARVILTVRDARSWYRSSVATVWAEAPAGQNPAEQTPAPGSADQRARVKTATVREIGFDILEDPRDEALTIAQFERYARQVEREVPADRLLVFDVAEGWEPLCAFLGVAAPVEPFPRENAAPDFQARFGTPPSAG
jgi:hypothetical protein